jgi:hypothetical protein
MEYIRRSTIKIVVLIAIRASADNERRVRSLLKIHFAPMGAIDPDEVHLQSSNYVLNIIYFVLQKG